MRPQSSMRPSTRQVAAPCSSISEMFTSGVSSGQNTTDSMPARDAYAASAAPALPLVGMARRRRPSSFAMDTASASPRALNEPVGSRPSSFTSNAPRLPSGRERGMRGVVTSPSEIRFTASRTGRSSRYRQNPSGRAARSSRRSARAMVSRS